MENISHERHRVYESVDDKSLSLAISQYLILYYKGMSK